MVKILNDSHIPNSFLSYKILTDWALVDFSSFIFLQGQYILQIFPNCMFWTLRFLDLSVTCKFLFLLSFDNKELCYLLNGCFKSPAICPEMGWYGWYQYKWKLHDGGWAGVCKMSVWASSHVDAAESWDPWTVLLSNRQEHGNWPM